MKFVSNDFVRLGGFATPEEADVKAIEVARGAPYLVYHQPEGTYSYTIYRDTELVCPIHPTGLYVKAWYFGGG